MCRLRRRELAWTPEDQATYAKWRRGVLAFYGCVGLVSLATFGAHQLVKDGAGRASAVVASAVKAPQAGTTRR